MKQQTLPEIPDHRIFGYADGGRIRASMFTGAGHPEAGKLRSWTLAYSEHEMARKLADLFEQPMDEAEYEILELLAGETEDVPCEDCGGSGVAVGGLSAYEPEDCPECGGSGHQTAPATVPALVGFGSQAPAPRIAVIGNGLYARTRKAVA